MSSQQEQLKFGWLEEVDFAHEEKIEEQQQQQPKAPSASSSKQQSAFVLPNGRNLYCRENEQKELLRVYEKMKATTDPKKTHVLMIRGSTGVGKTSLALSLRPMVETRDGGYFLVGKFQHRRPEPQTPFVDALNEFVDAVSARGEAEMERIRQAAAKSVYEEDRTILMDVFPALEKILVGRPLAEKKKTSVEKIPSDSDDTALQKSLEVISGSVHRFKQPFQRLVRAISSPAKPLVFLLDDFHCADESSLDILRNSIIMDSNNLGVLVLLTYRDEPGRTNENIVDKLPTPSKGVMEGTVIRLGNLSKDQVDTVVSKVFSIDREMTRELSTFIFSQSKGNFFSVFEYLRELSDGGFLQYRDGRLQWDMEEIRIELGGETDLILTKISELSEPSQDLLKIASCCGSRLDGSILMHFAKDSILHEFHEQAEKKGLILFDQNRESWQFAHDRVQEVVYEQLLSPNERDKLHYRIGRHLWLKFDMETLRRRIFVVVGQLMIPKTLMRSQKEKAAVAKLCLHAGERAVLLSNFYTAHLYLMHGVDLLGARSWRDEYDLSLRLHTAAAEIAYSSGQIDTALKLVNDICVNARIFDDTIRGRTIMIYALGSRGQVREATNSSLDLLKRLGEPLPATPTEFHLMASLRQIKKLSKGKADESILRLPTMDDRKKLEIMAVLNLSFQYTFISSGRKLAALLGCRMMLLSLKSGLSPVSCVGFSVYAALLCATGSVDEGYRFGKLAFAVYEKFNAKPYLARMSSIFFESVHCWKKPFQLSFRPLADAYQVGLQTGDVEFAFTVFNFSWVCRFSITPLQELNDEMHDYSRRMDFQQQELNLFKVKPLWQVAHNLMGLAAGDPKDLNGEIFSQTQIEAAGSKSRLLSSLICFPRMLLCYLFGDYEKAIGFARGSRELTANNLSPILSSTVLCFEALVEVALSRMRKCRRARRASRISRLLLQWSSKAPQNFLALHFLVDAEISALAADHRSAYRKYVTAIALANEAGSFLYKALANELCGRYLLERNDADTAEGFFREAILSYFEWDADAKAQHLVSELRVHGFQSLDNIHSISNEKDAPLRDRR